MAKSRHDVLFFDSDTMRSRELGMFFGEVCRNRSASNFDQLKREMEKARPDVLVYCHSVGDEAVLERMKDLLSGPEYEHIPVLVIVKMRYEEKVVSFFQGKRIETQNEVSKSIDTTAKLQELLDELDALPQVMIIEDDDEHRGKVVNMLGDWAMPVSMKSKEEATVFLEEQSVKLVVISASAQNNSGTVIYDAIRETVNGKKVPVLFLASNADKNTVIHCMKKENAGMVSRPYDKEDFKHRVIEAMSFVGEARRKTILVCDDDVMVLKTLQKLLQEEFEVICLNGGEQAIQYCATHVPDMIILDYEMPDRNGVYVLKHLRMEERFNNCPVIMLTGNKDRETVVATVAAGAQGYLVKPVNPMALRLRIRQLIGSVN